MWSGALGASVLGQACKDNRADRTRLGVSASKLDGSKIDHLLAKSAEEEVRISWERLHTRRRSSNARSYPHSKRGRL